MLSFARYTLFIGMLSVIVLIAEMISDVNAEWRLWVALYWVAYFIVISSDVYLSVVMLCVVMLSVVVLSVLAQTYILF
jgi:hypothetical protein